MFNSLSLLHGEGFTYLLKYNIIKRKKNQVKNDELRDKAVQCFVDQMQTFKNFEALYVCKLSYVLYI